MNGTSWDNDSAKRGRVGCGGAVVRRMGRGGATCKTAIYKEKLGQGLDKTKAVASSGFKMLKRGSAIGFGWVKDKYHKITNKH